MTDAFNIIVPLLKPKHKSIPYGSYFVRGGKMYFQSGRNIVYIREHFSGGDITPVRLVENTVRYEREMQNSVEIKDQPCYNERVNDVL